MLKEFKDLFIRFDRIHERDRQTDGRTPHDGIGRAYAWHSAAKILSRVLSHGRGGVIMT